MTSQTPRRPTVCLIDPLEDPRWDAFVDRTEEASIYHHSCWKAVIERTFAPRSYYLAIEDGPNSVKWGMPFFLKRSLVTGNALMSLPFSDYCDVLAKDEEEFQALWKRALAIAGENGARYIELRTRAGCGMSPERYGLVKGKTYLNHYLETGSDLEYLEKKVIEKSYKYDIRQAVRNGVVCTPATSVSDMKKYYGLYVATRTRHGLPPMPYAFFRNVWEVLRPSGMLHLFLARWEEKVIAGIVLLRHGDCMYALSNSSDARFLEKKPNHLLWWRGIQLAVELGVKGVDFGRTSLDNKGLQFFKRRWGTRELEIHHYRHNVGGTGRGNGSSFLNGRSNAVLPVLKRLPPWALQVVGNIAYRRLCLW
jgi:hypothetical protein